MHPLIAAIDDGAALVVNRYERGDHSAWIVSSQGDVRARFLAGTAIQDILASDRRLVITYSDESACCSSGIEGNGVAVFDTDGHYQFGYRELFGSEAVDIWDCCCACWAEDRRVLFLPYPEFPLVSFDLENRTQEIWRTPREVAGSEALTKIGQTVYFHGPYEDRSGVYRWSIGSCAADRIGDYPGRLRGLRGGRFLSVEASGYTIVSPTEA